MAVRSIFAASEFRRVIARLGIMLMLALAAHVAIHATLEITQHSSNSHCALCQAARCAAPMPVALYRPTQPQRAAAPPVAAAVWREQTLWHFPLSHRPPPPDSRG